MSRVITKVHELADQSKIGFAMAFLGSTGLLPEQAVMLYGVFDTPQGEAFKVWFERKSSPEHDNSVLLAENKQMAAMLAYIADKIGATDENLIETIDRMTESGLCGCVDKENRCSIAVH